VTQPVVLVVFGDLIDGMGSSSVPAPRQKQWLQTFKAEQNGVKTMEKQWENHGKIKKHQGLLIFVGKVARKSGFDVSKMGVT
jgi:hypothetical protein